MIRYNHQQRIFLPSLLGNSVVGGFTTRDLGDFRKIQIIQQFFDNNEIPYRKIAILEQIHSTNINETNEDFLGTVEVLSETDGLITKEQNVCICIRTADCVPILFYDPIRRVIGASHQGWRGTLKGLAGKMVQHMRALGSDSRNIFVAMGPYINACCYAIDSDRFALFMQEMERFEKRAFLHFGERYHVNLGRINYEILCEAGISPEHIDFFPFCTHCNKERFFSFRRFKEKKDEFFGEMMSFIMIKSV